MEMNAYEINSYNNTPRTHSFYWPTHSNNIKTFNNDIIFSYVLTAAPHIEIYNNINKFNIL